MSLGGAVKEEDAELISILFGSIGKIWKADEKYFDAITGLRYLQYLLKHQFPYTSVKVLFRSVVRL